MSFRRDKNLVEPAERHHMDVVDGRDPRREARASEAQSEMQ
jgi:hypothetical protein